MDWPDEVNFLREILKNKRELKETVKWGIPVFTYKGKNIVGVAKFKSYFGLWFYDGALLDDQHKVLINAQKGKTKALRQIRYTDLQDVDSKIIFALLEQAMHIVESDKTFKPEKQVVEIPLELKDALDKDKQLKAAFYKLTPYKRKEYSSYIDNAKRDSTKMKRLEKSSALIKQGKGLNDQYK